MNEEYFNEPDVTIESADGDKAYITLLAYEKGSGYPPLIKAFDAFSDDCNDEAPTIVSDETKYYELESGREIGPDDRQDWVIVVNTKRFLDKKGNKYTYIDRTSEAGASGVVESILIGLATNAVFEIGKRFLKSLPYDFYVPNDDESADDAIRKHLLFEEGATPPVTLKTKQAQDLVSFEAIDNDGVRYRGSYAYMNGGRLIRIHHHSKTQTR